MAKVILNNGWEGREFTGKYTCGFEEYAAYVQQFLLEWVEQIAIVPAEKIYEAARLYATNGPAGTQQSSSPVTQHRNGFQNYRAVNTLAALTGNIDRKGGLLPSRFSYNYRGGAGSAAHLSGFRGRRGSGEIPHAVGHQGPDSQRTPLPTPRCALEEKLQEKLKCIFLSSGCMYCADAPCVKG